MPRHCVFLHKPSFCYLLTAPMVFTCRLFDLVLLTDDLSSDYQEDISYHSLLQSLHRDSYASEGDSPSQEGASPDLERITNAQLKQASLLTKECWDHT